MITQHLPDFIRCIRYPKQFALLIRRNGAVDSLLTPELSDIKATKLGDFLGNGYEVVACNKSRSPRQKNNTSSK